MTEKTRKLLKDRFDTLSIPNCVIKNRPTHGARHGNTEEQRINHMAYNTYKRCRKKKKRWYNGSLSEQSKVQSITNGTWNDRRVVCKTRRTCAGGPFIQVNSQRKPTPRINLDRSSQQFGHNGPMSDRPDFEEAVRIKIVCKMSQVKRMGEFIPASRDDNEVTTHFWRQVKEVHVLIARRDGSGIGILLHGRLLNFGGHCPAGTSSLIISKKVAGFRFQEMAIPCDRRRECAQYTSHETFSRMLSCVAWLEGLTAQVSVVRVLKSFPSMSHERAFLIPRFTSPLLLSCTHARPLQHR